MMLALLVLVQLAAESPDVHVGAAWMEAHGGCI
jgi:hypothetical protein